jgi:hypothetical protein
MANQRGPGWGQHPIRTAIAGMAVAGYSWFAGGIASFTTAATIAVVIPWLVLGVIFYGWSERIPPPERLDATGASYWAIVTMMFFEWEAAGFKDGSNYWHPTLSVVAGPLLDHHHAVKSVAFAAWLLGGWALMRR